MVSGPSGLPYLKAHQDGGESVECSNLLLCTIIGVFSFETVVRSVSNDFDA